MDKNIQNIGKFNYLLTSLIGKNRKVRYIKTKDNGEHKIDGDFIITIGKKHVILTDYQNGRRVPIIVKKWKETKEDVDRFMDTMRQTGNLDKEPNIKTKIFIDSDGLKWEYNFSNLSRNEWIMVYETNGNELYNIVLK